MTDIHVRIQCGACCNYVKRVLNWDGPHPQGEAHDAMMEHVADLVRADGWCGESWRRMRCQRCVLSNTPFLKREP